MKIVTAEQMRQIDRECIRRGTPGHVLMENAGRAVAEETRRVLGTVFRKRILCLVGPGNNGGDGLVAARYLQGWGAEVSVYLCSPRPEKDRNLERAGKQGVSCFDAASDNDLSRFDGFLNQADCIIDALFGTGKARPLEGIFSQVLQRVIEAKKKKPGLLIVAVDLPSGLNADTGEVDPACPHADYTVTFAFPKPGHFSFPGAEHVGRLTIADIGIPALLADSLSTELTTDDWARATLPKRPLNSHKGTFGHLLVVAGSINYIGAAYLACEGAMRAGAGLVTLATPQSLQPILAARLTETIYLPLPESPPGIVSPQAADLLGERLENYDALVIGCGLGQNPATLEFIRSLLFRKGLPPLALDADALNNLAGIREWWRHIKTDAVITPHPGEMSHLSGRSIAEIQSSRLETTRTLAQAWQKTIVLKGAYSIVASPGGQCRVSPFANPGLASAGTGDVLTGVIGGLLAQGLSLFDAASLGVYLHGKAGELVRETLGEAGMLASDLPPILPAAIKRLKES